MQTQTDQDQPTYQPGDYSSLGCQTGQQELVSHQLREPLEHLPSPGIQNTKFTCSLVLSGMSVM